MSNDTAPAAHTGHPRGRAKSRRPGAPLETQPGLTVVYSADTGHWSLVTLDSGDWTPCASLVRRGYKAGTAGARTVRPKD
eukprot:5013880-Prymnesium_polylepis.1